MVCRACEQKMYHCEIWQHKKPIYKLDGCCHLLCLMNLAHKINAYPKASIQQKL